MTTQMAAVPQPAAGERKSKIWRGEDWKKSEEKKLEVIKKEGEGKVESFDDSAKLFSYDLDSKQLFFSLHSFAKPNHVVVCVQFALSFRGKRWGGLRNYLPLTLRNEIAVHFPALQSTPMHHSYTISIKKFGKVVQVHRSLDLTNQKPWPKKDFDIKIFSLVSKFAISGYSTYVLSHHVN